MGDEVGRMSSIDRLCWWLVDAMSAALDRDERVATRGDLTESAVPAWRAVHEMLGLVLRRQLAVWAHLGPWLALLTVAVPTGIAIAHLGQFWADGNAAYLWMYATGAGPQSLRHTIWGGAPEPTALVPWLCLNAITVAGWAWVAGVAARSMAGNATLLVAPAFLAALVLGTPTVSVGGFSHSAPSATLVYGAVVPVVLRVCLVALPLLAGLIHAGRLPSRRIRVLMVVAVGLLTLRGLPSLEVALQSGWTSALVERGHWATRLGLAAITMWPPVYLLFRPEARGRYSRASIGEP
jgi:hypothetical protein